MIYQTRIDGLRQMMADQQISLVAVNAGSDLSYLTGLSFHLSERPAILLIPMDGLPCFIFPEFESEKVEIACVEMSLFPYPEDPEKWVEIVNMALHQIDRSKEKIAVAPESFRFLEMQLIQRAAPEVAFISAADLFKSLRMTKDEFEQIAIRKAVKIAEDAFRLTIPLIQPGKSEIEVANNLFINILKQGSSADLPFNPIVASGPNSANPHAIPGDRCLQTGDMIIMDWGACFEGYISDITRTLYIGDIPQQALDITNTVMAANRTAREKIKPGIQACEVDTAARQVITAAGYGENFIHRTGHGIGMKAHEEPYISSSDSTSLAPGMVFTIEPGIYLPGWGGVRIEDNVLVTSGGAETITQFPRELIHVPA